MGRGKQNSTICIISPFQWGGGRDSSAAGRLNKGNDGRQRIVPIKTFQKSFQGIGSPRRMVEGGKGQVSTNATNREKQDCNTEVDTRACSKTGGPKGKTPAYPSGIISKAEPGEDLMVTSQRGRLFSVYYQGDGVVFLFQR